MWPHLNKIYYSGTALGAHRAQMEELVGAELMTRSVYSATEGVIAAEVEPGAGGAMRPMTDMAVVTLRPEAGGALVPLWRLEEGRRYEIFLTTVSGLLQYKIGDLIEVASARPLRIRVAGRAGDEINLATEKLSCSQVEAVMKLLCGEMGVSDERFIVAPDPLIAGRHLWMMESQTGESPDTQRIASLIDRHLGAINPSYAALRAGDSILRPPRVIVLPPGAFEPYIRAGIASHGQFKFRHICPTAEQLTTRAGLEGLWQDRETSV